MITFSPADSGKTTISYTEGKGGTQEVELIITDAAGNVTITTYKFETDPVVTTPTGTPTTTPDTTAPAVALASTQSSPTNASTINMTATFSEDVTGFELSDILVVGGTAGNFSASSGAVYNFDITVAAAAITVDIAAATAQDGAGNQNIAATQFAISYDTTAPEVSGVSYSSANGTYGIGAMIPIEVTFTEAVTVTGVPQLTLETGGSDAVVDYTSGSGGSTLTFNYTIAAPEISSE